MYDDSFVVEREAAFNLLSTYNKKIEAKTAKKKERVRIALQVLERFVSQNHVHACI